MHDDAYIGRRSENNINVSCMMISGGRTKQLVIFFRVTGFTSDFRPLKTSADICVVHDDLGWKNQTRNRFWGAGCSQLEYVDIRLVYTGWPS